MTDRALEYLRLETYQYTIPGYETVWWNVTAAKAEVAKGHTFTTVPIAREEMQGIATRNDFDEAHLAAVDDTQPGIGAPLYIPGEGVIYILIDGTHRCVKALRAGRTFSAQLLTNEAAMRCVLRGDARLLKHLTHGRAAVEGTTDAHV